MSFKEKVEASFKNKVVQYAVAGMGFGPTGLAAVYAVRKLDEHMKKTEGVSLLGAATKYLASIKSSGLSLDGLKEKIAPADNLRISADDFIPGGKESGPTMAR